MITSAEEFVRLRSSEIMEEYLQAANDTAELHVWLEIIEKYPDFHKWVAHNKSIPNEIIGLLAKSPAWEVRSTIADKRKTPPDILQELSRDSHETVRHRVACNAKTPTDILVSMLDDPWAVVVETVKKKLALRESVQRRKQLEVLDFFGTIEFEPNWDYKKERQKT